MPFEFIRLEIPDVVLIKPQVFEDDRGFLWKHRRLLILQRLVSSRGTQAPRDPSLCSGRHPGMSSRGTLPFLSSRGAQAPRDPSLRSGRQRRARGDKKEGSG